LKLEFMETLRVFFLVFGILYMANMALMKASFVGGK
jgi:hypothetical protein